MKRVLQILLAWLCVAFFSLNAVAEDGSAAWLRYAPIPNPALYKDLPSRIAVIGNTPTDRAAAEELRKVLDLFTYQAGHAIVWRDAINTWFQHTSLIDDAKRRVGHDPDRIEAESMNSVAYTTVRTTPGETASGSTAVLRKEAAGCSLSTTNQKPAGTYDVAVQYFDLRTGISHYALAVNGKELISWAANDTLPPAVVRPLMDGQTSTRFTAHNVVLQPGDSLTLRGGSGRSCSQRAKRRSRRTLSTVDPRRPGARRS